VPKTKHATKKKARALAEAIGLTYQQALGQVHSGPVQIDDLGIAPIIAAGFGNLGPNHNPKDPFANNRELWKGARSDLNIKGDPTRAKNMKFVAGGLVAQELKMPEGGKIAILGVQGRQQDGSFLPQVMVQDPNGNRTIVDLTPEKAKEVSFHG